MKPERSRPRATIRRGSVWLAAACVAALASCGRGRAPESDGDAEAATAAAETPRPLRGSLAWAADGDWRPDEERARDAALVPLEVLEALHVDPAGATMELWPGGGQMTAIIAPAAAAQGGTHMVALARPAGDPEAGPEADDEARAMAQRFAARFDDPALFGDLVAVPLGPETGPLAAPELLDAVFTVDDVAAWMALGFAEKAFADAYAALKPGGWFGVVAPRASYRGVQDPAAPTGYVQEAYVRRLAEEAGFDFEASLDLLANPADDADHPFGVWTLAPYRLTAPLGAPADPAFDRAPYDAIGEPDRMTLVFRKRRRPASEENAPDESEPDASAESSDDG